MQHDCSNYYSFAPLKKDSSRCGTLILYNTTAIGATDILINSINLQRGNQGFSFADPITNYPFVLKKGASLSIPICLKMGSQFHVGDTLMVHSSCENIYRFVLLGSNVYAKIKTPDHNYGGVAVKATDCQLLSVKNIGLEPLIVTSLTLSDTVNFGIALTSPSLPATIAPGAEMYVRVCFHPTSKGEHSTILTWNTNLTGDALADSKVTSVLTGIGLIAELRWDRQLSNFITDSISPAAIINRIFLVNRSPFSATVSKVNITGSDASEFFISASQRGQSDNYTLPASDSNWYEIIFTPDISKPYPMRFANREALLTCNYISIPVDNTVDSPSVQLHGIFAGVSSVSAAEDQSNGAATVEGSNVIFNPPSILKGDCKAYLYDILGREVRHWEHQTISERITLPTGHLASGTYILMVTSGQVQVPYRIQVVK